MSGSEGMKWSERVFRTLFRSYPRFFREVYETDATELFRDRLREARESGAGAVTGLWCRTIPGVLFNGALERVGRLGQRDGAPDRGVTARNAIRSLVRAPGLSVTVVLTLGVGIGANVALYSVLRGVLLKPLPYPEAERLVHLWETNPAVDDELHGPSPWNFHDWERSVDSFESMTAWYLTSGTYRTTEWVEEVRSAQVTADFFRTLGVTPLLGRDFRSEEVVLYGPVMLSHGFWQRRFGGDPDVVGQTILSSGNSYEIIGVMPPDFTFPDESVQAWVAWSLPGVYEGNTPARTWRFLNGLGRLGPDVSAEAAEAELDQVAAGLAESYPDMDRGWDVALTSLHDHTVGEVRGTLWIAFGAVLFILLIACANVANLLLARVPHRAREIGIRMTLGATRGRVALELIVENLLLALAAALLGLLTGGLIIDLLVSLDAGRIPRLSEVSIDLSVFLFTVLIAAVTSVASGVAPIVQTVRGSAGASLRHGVRTTGGRGQRRLLDMFVGSQVAIALVLMTGAGLFVSSLNRLMTVDPGIDPERVASFRISLDPVAGDPGATVRYYDGLIERLDELPEVVASAASTTIPLNPVANDFVRPYRAAGAGTASGDASTVQMRIVTPGYVDVIGMTLVGGGDFPARTEPGEPLLAIVNETLAGHLWSGSEAVGSTFEIDFRDGWQPYRVVGVVRDVKHHGLRASSQPEVFLLHQQVPYLAMTIVAKTRGAPEEATEVLRDVVLSHTPLQPPHNFVSVEELLAVSTAEERFLSVLLMLLGTIGVLLSCTGVYGVIASTVSHQRREIGVRMALGAAPERVVGAVFRRATAVAGAGLVVGIVGVMLLGGMIDGLLFGITARDPRVTLAGAGLLIAVSAFAAWLPARRAAWVPPSEALRAE